MPTDQRSDADQALGAELPRSADAVDRAVVLSPRWTLISLAACVLLVASAVIWAFNGRIQQTQTTAGVLRDEGASVVATGRSGIVKEVLVSPGEQVYPGQSLVTYTAGPPTLASYSGTVVTVFLAEGSPVDRETAVAALTQMDAPYRVYTLVPADLVGQVAAGMPVEMEVASAPAATYGYLKGTIVSISSSPVSAEAVARKFSMDPEVVTEALPQSPGLLATIGLQEDPNAPTGYAWTIGEGPSYQLPQGTPVTVSVILSEKTPVQILFPSLAS